MEVEGDAESCQSGRILPHCMSLFCPTVVVEEADIQVVLQLAADLRKIP